MNGKTIIIAAVAATLAVVPTVALASSSGETSNLIPPGAPSGYLAINKTTCKFLHPEIDVKPTAMERYARAEDSRDDVKLNCLTNRKPTASKAALLYKSVYATGTGQFVTAQCPAGYFVTGGGSHQEVKGSYPVGNDGWQVVRDPQSPTVLSASAICIQVTS